MPHTPPPPAEQLVLHQSGVWLPAQETHLQEHIARGPLYRGRGTYQLFKLEAAMAYLPPDRRGLAADVGAHVGLWSWPLAHLFSRLMAWEPVPLHAEAWRRNIVLPGATLVEAALGDLPGPAAIVACGGNTGGTAISQRAASLQAAPPEDLVPVHRLDDAGLRALDFLKIDVEGLEELVLRGGEETIRTFCPVCVVEQKPGHAERHGLPPLGAVTLLEKWGATVEEILHGDYIMRWRR